MPDDAPRQLAKRKYSHPVEKLRLDPQSVKHCWPLFRLAQELKQLFPSYEGTREHIHIARLRLIADECRRLLRVLPDEVNRYNSALDTRRSARQSFHNYQQDPEGERATFWRNASERLYDHSDLLLKSYGPLLANNRAVWLWLQEAMRAEMLDFDAPLARIDSGTWSDTPEPNVYTWLAAVHDSAEARACHVQKHLEQRVGERSADEPPEPAVQEFLLDAQNRVVWIGKSRFDDLSQTQVDALTALILAGPEGLTGTQLQLQSGRGGARNALVTLRQREPAIAVHVIMPGTKKSGNYRVLNGRLLAPHARN